MMTPQMNARLTAVGKQAPAGQVMRCFWQPIALSEELEPARPVKALRLFGQDFVLFRNDKGDVGLLDRDCPHRGADLAFGRLEDGGLRCAFHGWLFDVEGRCLETPGEPEGSRLCHRVRQGHYPVIELSGSIFAFLGDGPPPPLPQFDCLTAPEAYTFSFKGHLQCNWLQAVEVGVDPAHASFLHRFFEDEDPGNSYGRQFRGASAETDIPMTKVLREYARPEISVESVDFGLRVTALRHIDPKQTHVRVTNLVFPNAFVIPLSGDITITQWHVPVDDENCYWHAIFTSFADPIDRAEMRAQRLELYTLPDYLPRKNKSNHYGFDSVEQQEATYTGMGFDINVHDAWAIESQGAIQDRTREHLGTSDKAIVAYRKLLLAEISRTEKGEIPKIARQLSETCIGGPATIDTISPVGEHDACWRSVDLRLRAGSAWNPAPGFAS